MENIKLDKKTFPWTNQCSNSLILAWRDHIFQNITMESTEYELAGDYSLSRDLFVKPVVRTGLLAKLQAWVAKELHPDEKQRPVTETTRI